MFIPQTPESTWLQILRDLPAFDPLSKEFLVIAPHPDDETLACGGLIAALRARSIPVRVLAVTDGENAYPEAGNLEDGKSESTQLAASRREEQTRALEFLGVPPQDIVPLHLPDGSVAAHHAELVDRIARLTSADTHILAPWIGDFHPDHEACGRAAIEAAFRSGADLTFWLFWTWHRHAPEAIAELPLHTFALTPEQLRAKTEALRCHDSQLFRTSGDPILPEHLLAPARRPFEVFIPPRS